MKIIVLVMLVFTLTASLFTQVKNPDSPLKGKWKRRETMKIIKSFCRGSRGTVFSKRVPLVIERT